MSISKSDLRHLSKPGFAALAIGLLGWVAVSSPTHAETFTLQDLDRGASFTIGNVQFFNWSVKDAGLDEELITVETIEDPELPGFTIFGNGELRGDRVDLEYEFEVRTINLLPLIFGGVLELTGFSRAIDSEIDIETDEGILNLNVFINDFTDEIQLLDAGVLREPTPRTKFEGRVRTDQNEPGAHEVESYTTQILVVSSEACGDGMVGGGEECDPPDGTTCDDNCLDISCGNEIVQPGEECDPPDGVTCDDTCQELPISCGNDLRQPGEECDGTDDGACPGACELDCRCPGGPDPICGDDTVDPGEDCDPPDGVTCDGSCVEIPIACGNDLRQPGEQCDGTDDVACPGACQGDCTCGPDPICGDDTVDPGEDCDPPNGVTCDGSCQDIPIACGNDLRQPGEQCDGTDDAACPSDCLGDCTCNVPPTPICGDDTVDPGEDCDPPNGVTCDGSCQDIPIACGNDLRQPGEQCDGTDDAACPSDCLGDCTCDVSPTPFCGDEVVDAGEDCDPPNGVTCDDSCQDIPIACGNDLRQPGEQCDGTDDAACPGTCQVDCTCSGGPGPYCGDGVMDAPDEECDGADDAACAAGCLLDCTCRRVVLCPFEVDLSCIAADKASLKIDEKKEGTEKLKVSLQKLSAATTPADFGDPVSGTTLYEVCVYGEGGTLVGPLRVDRAGDVCGSKGKPCWAAKKAGPAYNDPDAASGGVKKIQTKSGDAGKGQMKADAANNAKKGQTSLPTGITDRLVGATQATVQVQTDDAACFGATLDEVKKNDADTFQAKLKN